MLQDRLLKTIRNLNRLMMIVGYSTTLTIAYAIYLIAMKGN